MPRIRTIKPDFFQHESLYDAEKSSGLPLRIAFAGLWTVADKAGRFEWRPRQLKLNVLPYDDCDFGAVLEALESSGFLIRYEADGKIYGCIPSWEKHQHRNVREPDSVIPAPDQIPDWCDTGTEQVQVPAQAAGKGRERKGKEGEDAALDRARLTPGLQVPVFDRWLAYRSEIRKPIKPISLEAAARDLAAYGADQSAVVEQSIANSWQGLFPLKSKPNGKAQAPPKREREPTPAEIAEARRKAIEDNAAALQKLGLAGALKGMP